MPSSKKAIWVLSSSRKASSGSPIRGCTLTGFPPREILGRPFTDLIAPESRRQYQAKQACRLFRDGTELYETKLLTRNDERLTVEITASPIEYDRKPAYMLILHDITERKQAQESLMQSQ
jgi:PAS domain S-box-containing protein